MKKALAAGEVTDGVVVLVARMPHANMREAAAAREILRAGDSRRPMGLREAGAHVQSRYILALRGAPVSVKIPRLCPASAHVRSARSTGANPAIFGDIQRYDLCLCGIWKEDRGYHATKSVPPVRDVSGAVGWRSSLGRQGLAS
jgi:hypothetical protein